MKPRARKVKLVIETLPSETLVYDLEWHKIHRLNLTAGLVWRYCDGDTSIEEMAGRLGSHLDTPPNADVIRMAVRQLSDARLLELSSAGPLTNPAGCNVNRRPAAWVPLLPGVVSFAVPELASAKSKSPASNGLNRANRPKRQKNGSRSG